MGRGDVPNHPVTHHGRGAVYETVAGLEVALDEETLEAGDLGFAQVLALEGGHCP